MEDNYSKDLISFRILLLGGGTCAGKTCILNRYCENKFKKTIFTMGIEYRVKKIKFGEHNIN